MEITSIEKGTFERMNEALNRVVAKICKAPDGGCTSLAEWLDNQDVCLMLDVSPRKLLSLRQKGSIPFSRIDRKIYYHKKDIQQFINQHLKKVNI